MIESVLYINPDNKLSIIAPEIYGQFSEHLGRCIYEGIYVGEDSDIPNTKGMRNDVIKALKDVKLPVLRWPGGCFADEYHWKDGIGPKEDRRRMVNTNWGGVVEDNSFGTHEFMELCEQIGCEPYIAINLGSGTVQEAAEWIEYMTAEGESTMAKLRAANGHTAPWHLKYIGVGNENWGCGGGMLPDFYANEYRRYQTFCKDYGNNKLFKVACGPNADDYNWTKVLMSKINKWHAKAIDLHYYTLPTGEWDHKGSATEFTDKEYYSTIKNTLKMEELITKHLEIMNEEDPDHDIDLIVDEWGTWYDVEPGTNPGFLYQQNTMRDAIVAAINLNIFNKHSNRIVMANIAQVVNVLQAMILTDGCKMIKTPTYEVFDMYKEHQGAELVESHLENTMTGVDSLEIPSLSESVSISSDKALIITLSNASLTDDASVNIVVPKNYKLNKTDISMLHEDAHSHNTFENPYAVCQNKHSENVSDNFLTIELPACTVCTIRCEYEEF